jgi:chromosome segregation ATPase
VSDGLITSIIASLVLLFGHFTVWLLTRNKDKGQITLSHAELDEKRRTGDLNTIITTLQSELTRALKERHDTLARLDKLEEENRECWNDRETMRQAMSRLQLKVDRLEQSHQGGS